MLGNKDKEPVYSTGHYANSWNPISCYLYKDAKRHVQAGKVSTVGLQAFDDDDYFLLDLDNLVDLVKGKPELTCAAKEIIELCNFTYYELSYSKSGVHIVGTSPHKNALAKKLKRRKIQNTKQRIPIDGRERIVGVELFLTGGWLRLSGNVPKVPSPVKEIEYENLLKIIKKYIPNSYYKVYPHPQDRYSHRNTEQPNRLPNQKTTFSMEQIKESMFNSKNSKKIKNLFHGDISPYNQDASKADMAMLRQLHFFSQGDHEMCLKLFETSKLWRTSKKPTREKYVTYLKDILDSFDDNDIRKPNYWGTLKKKN